MTKDEKREYNKQYRRDGFGACMDALYRKRHLSEYRKRNAERMKLKRLLEKQKTSQK